MRQSRAIREERHTDSRETGATAAISPVNAEARGSIGSGCREVLGEVGDSEWNRSGRAALHRDELARRIAQFRRSKSSSRVLPSSRARSRRSPGCCPSGSCARDHREAGGATSSSPDRGRGGARRAPGSRARRAHRRRHARGNRRLSAATDGRAVRRRSCSGPRPAAHGRPSRIRARHARSASPATGRGGPARPRAEAAAKSATTSSGGRSGSPTEARTQE